MKDKSILSTLRYWEYAEWTNRVDVVDRGNYGLAGFLRAVVAGARTHRAVVLTGTWRADQLAAVMLARLRNPPRVIMTDATWERGTSLPDRFANAAGMRGMRGPHMSFCVLSSYEVGSFPRTWHVSPDSVRFTPFCFTVPEADLDVLAGDDGSVFAGGDSLRDYGPLLEVASDIPASITIASRRLEGVEGSDNLAVGPVPPERFSELFRQAKVIVVPLKASTDRSAGQQTYLNAMALGKPVIVTDAPGVRDYIEDRETGLIVPPQDSVALAGAIRWILDPVNDKEVTRVRERARDVARSRFTRDHYIQHILDVVDEVASGSSGGA